MVDLRANNTHFIFVLNGCYSAKNGDKGLIMMLRLHNNARDDGLDNFCYIYFTMLKCGDKVK